MYGRIICIYVRIYIVCVYKYLISWLCRQCGWPVDSGGIMVLVLQNVTSWHFSTCFPTTTTTITIIYYLKAGLRVSFATFNAPNIITKLLG